MWIYHICKMKFVFHSNADDHKDLTEHDVIEKVMMISATDTLA